MAGDSFKDFVLDQLATLPGLRARAMFGGHGLYADGKFFGIMFDGRLFFKVSEQTRGDYEERGMEPFTYEMPGRTITMTYYEVPADVLEDRMQLLDWAQIAMATAAAVKKESSKPRSRSMKSQRRRN